MKRRTKGHTETTISGDTRADWSEAFELVPSIQIAYVWHAILNSTLVISSCHHALAVEGCLQMTIDVSRQH